FFIDVAGIVYMVDAADHARLAESKRELDALLTHEQLTQTPVAVFANKVDRPGAAGPEQLRHVLGLAGTTTGLGPVPDGTRAIELFTGSLVQRAGFQEPFQWIAQFM